MPCTITDYLSYYDSSLGPQALPNQQVLAVPGADFYRVKISAAYRLLSLNPDITSAAYKFGIVATTDSNGMFSFSLPYATTETHPTVPSPQWSLVLPEGRLFSGVVPAVAGPLTVDTLITTYGWVEADSVYVAPVTAGRLARGTAVFSGGTVATVLLVPAFAASTYQIKLAPSLDSVTNQIPAVAWSEKSTSGFKINVSGQFTGSVDWEAVL